MKHIVHIEVDAENKGQAFAIVQGVIDNSDTYNHIQGWKQPSLEIVEVKEKS